MVISPTLHSIFCPIDSDLDLSKLKIVWQIFYQFDKVELSNARLVCRRWEQWTNKINIVKNYNYKLMLPDEVRQEAASYLRNPESLQIEQHFLLNLVKLSAHYRNIQNAAANALMLLKKMRFCFANLEFKGIQVPGVRLSRTLLDGVNFAGANLQRADLTDCSLHGICFDKADLKEVQFNQLPNLVHLGSKVLTMALAPNGKYLASVDEKTLYLRNLERLEPPQSTNIKATKPFHLCFSPDSQWLICAHDQGGIEIWKCDPLAKVNHLNLENTRQFFFLAFTRDGTHFVSISDNKQRKVGLEVCVWHFEVSDEGIPQAKVVKKRLLEDDIYELKYEIAPQGHILAVASLGNKTIHLYSLPHLDTIRRIQLNESERLKNILFKPDRDALLIAKDVRKSFFIRKPEIQFLDLETEKSTIPFIEEEYISHWEFLPNSQKLAYTTNQGKFCIRKKEDFSIEIQEEFANLKTSRFDEMDKQLWLSDQYLYQLCKDKIVPISLQKFKKRKQTGLHAHMQKAGFSADEQNFYAIDRRNELYSYKSATGPKASFLAWDKRAVGYPNEWIFKNSTSCFFSHLKEIVDRVNEPPLTINKSVIKYALSQDGDYLVVAYRGGLEVWKTASKQMLGAVTLPSDKEVGHLVSASIVFPQAHLLTIEIGQKTNVCQLWQVNWEKQSVKRIAKLPKIENTFFVDPSYLLFKQADSIVRWDYKIDQKETIPCYRLNSFAVTPDGAFMVTLQQAEETTQMKLSLWDLKQKERLHDQMLPPISSSSRLDNYDFQPIHISPRGKYVIYWDVSLHTGLQGIWAWQVKEGKLHLVWKIPKTLEGSEVSLKDVRNLSQHNAQLLSQLASRP